MLFNTFILAGISSTNSRGFSTTAPLLSNPDEGTELDDDIMSNHSFNRQPFDAYFERKEQSIRDSYRIDSNNAAAEGTGSSELDDWMDYRNSLLAGLDSQREDLLELNDYLRNLGSLPASSSYSDTEEATTSATQEEGNPDSTNSDSINPDYTNADSTNAGESSSNIAEGEAGPSNYQERFGQDTRHISDDFPSSWEPFDD